LNGTNVFNNNLLDGLNIDANGSIVIYNVTANSNGANGLFLQSTANITVNCCTTAANNGEAGAYANLPGIFFLRMGNFDGNGSGEYIRTGGGRSNIAYCVQEREVNPNKNINKPTHKVTLTSEQTVPLECTAFGGTLLTLPKGDSAYLPCPISDEATLASLTEADLVDALPEGLAFASGFNLRVDTEGGSFAIGGEATFANVMMTISFVIPENQLGADLALLSWNGSKWVEVEGAIIKDGRITAQVDYDGLFVLVSK
jgi:hypothetical protein